MHRHSREHARYHRARIIKRWEFIYRNVHYYNPTRGDWWEGREGYLKEGQRCSCRLCRYDRWISKFKREKRKVYHVLDLLEAGAY